MTAGIVFEDPPESHHGGPRGSSPLGQWLAELRNHPGRWARWHHRVGRSAGTVIRNGRGYGVQPGEFEATCREQDKNGQGWLYARYIGGES